MTFTRLATLACTAAFIAGAPAFAFAQTPSAPASGSAGPGTGNPAWSKPDVQAEPPTPNGGMSSGAHKGNESPTNAGNSANGQNETAESQQNKDRATSGQK